MFILSTDYTSFVLGVSVIFMGAESGIGEPSSKSKRDGYIYLELIPNDWMHSFPSHSDLGKAAE